MSQQLPSMLCFGALGLLAVAGVLLKPGNAAEETTEAPRVYELRTYTAAPGKLAALHTRFRDHTMKLFEKHGMKNVVYLTPTDEKLADNTLVYLISHASREAADKSWDGFRNDPEWIKVYKESQVDGKLVEKVESRFLLPTDYSPLK